MSASSSPPQVTTSSKDGSETQFIWQDREIRFDVPLPLVFYLVLYCNSCYYSAMELRKGEILVDSIDSVEDTKGNNGEQGCLTITNLRIIWASSKYPKTNLSCCTTY